jgi:hypothetical protein
MDSVSPATRARARALDAACAAAVDLARAAAVDAAGNDARVGEWLGADPDGDRVVTHRFRSLDRAYRGWHWAVTVARASRARNVTVDEVVLLPGEEALLAPPWVPWHERLRPGDLGVGDVMVTPEDDERLVPSYASGDDPEEEAVAYELGLGRVRVLSLDGRDDAATRWYAGSTGPSAPIAKAAPGRCASCGFWVPLRGALGQLFGACANEFAPDDGHVVTADHGCGAHSEAAVQPEPPQRSQTRIDTVGYDVLDTSDAAAGTGTDPVTVADTDTEELGHS